MNYNKRLLEQSQEELYTSGSYFSADGTFDDDFMVDFDGDNEMYASGMTGGGSLPSSQPYILQIANSTTNAVSNVTIGNAYENLQTGVSNFGNPAAITVTNGYGGSFDYGQFLFQTVAQPFRVGLTYLYSSNSTQVLEVLTITYRDSNGRTTTNPVVPTLSPDQYQSGVQAINFSYMFDGYASLSFSVLASASLTLRFYPAEKVNAARIVSGRPAEATFGNPRISTPRTAVLVPRGATSGRNLLG